MTDETKIETGIPIPPKTVRATRWASIALDMGIGDSVLVNNSNEAAGLGKALKIRGKGYTQRNVENGKVRVWRMA